MEISRLIFSKETKEKMNKPLSPQEKGKLRWEKLKEAEGNGVLQKAKRRVDIGKIVGIENYQTSYSWVSGLINKGAIIERIAGFEDGTAVYEYSLGKELSYEHGRKRREDIGAKPQSKVQPIKVSKTHKKRQSRRQMGKLRWEKLMENVVDGKLIGCTNRNGIIKLVGYSKAEYYSGYSWVNNMITRRHLIEKRVGTDSNGLAVFEYTIGSQPNYRLKSGLVAKERGIVEPIAENKPSVIITYGKLRIEFNDTNADAIKDTVIALIDKIKE